jgi:hypothetical protein
LMLFDPLRRVINCVLLFSAIFNRPYCLILGS